MKWIKRFFDFYINSSIHVALASTALVYLTFLKLETPHISNYLLFSFFSAVVGYNFVKYLQVSNLYYRKLTRSMRSIRLFTILCIVAMGYFFFQLSFIKLFWLLVPFSILTILYAIPFLPNTKNLRSIAGVKIYVIAVVWAGVTVVVPIYYTKGDWNFAFLAEAIQRFLFVLVLMLPFEIRDVRYDHKELRTIPQQLGIQKTKILGSLLLLVFMAIGYVQTNFLETEGISDSCIAAITLFFLWNSKKERTKYYCSFWVESIPLMWVGIYVGLSTLFT